MLNERQEYLLKSMLMIFKGEERKTKKYHICCISPFYKTVEKDKFNASDAARIMTDDFLAITFDEDNNYIVVSDRSGVYISNDIVERNNYFEKLKSEGIAKLVLAYKVKGLPLPKQLRLELEVE